MAALDFPSSPTLNQQYTGPNGVTYQWDGAAWVTIGSPAGIWTDTGTTLTPTGATRTVTVTASGGQITLGDATIKATLDQGTTGNSVLAIHENHPWSPQDTTKASYALFLDSTNDRVLIYRRAPGAAAGTVTQPFLLDSAGNLTLIGSNNPVVLGSRTVKSRLLALTTVDYSGITNNQQWTGSAFVRDDASKSGWIIYTRLDSDQFAVDYMSTAGQSFNNLNQTAGGDLTIRGSNATKASGTTWANPSDPRLKDDVIPYPHGLADILQLEPISYTLNGLAGTPAGMRSCGFDAEAVRAIFPDCVSSTRGKLHPDDEEESDILALDIHGILIALVNAVKELAAKVG